MAQVNTGVDRPLPSAWRFTVSTPVLWGIGFAGIGYLVWLLMERWAVQLGGASPYPTADGVFIVLLSVQAGYFVSVVPLLRRAGRNCAEQLRPLLNYSDPGLSNLIDRFNAPRPLLLPPAIVAGGVLTVVLQELQFSRFSSWFGQPDAALGELWMLLTAWATWSVGLSAIGVVIKDAAAMRRLGHKYVAIDLLRIEELAAFSRFGLHLAGAVIGLMVLWSVSLVLVTSLAGRTMTERSDYVGLLMVIAYICLSVIVFIFPQLGIRKRVRAEKALVCQQLTLMLPVSIESCELAQCDHQQMAALLSTRDHIQSISEWPIGQSTRLRLAFYLFVPLFSWSAAALVEELISRLLA